MIGYLVDYLRQSSTDVNKNTRIFLTGATGFTGSYIARTLLKQGYSSLTAIKRSSSSIDLLNGQEGKISWIEADLQDVDAIDNSLKDIDVIIHAAAIVNFKGKDKHAVYACNVHMVHDLVNLALKNNIKKFIHFSSIAAMGRTGDGTMVDENTEWVDSPFNSDYGKSKYLGEMEVWRASAEGLPVVILNPSLIMGAGFWHNTTPAIYKEVERGHNYYPLGTNGMVDVRDVAKAVILALDDKIVNERFLLNADNTSYFDMFSTIAKHINAIIPTKPLTKTLHSLMTSGTRMLELLPIKLPFSSQQLQVLNSISNYNAAKSRELLGMEYRSIEETLVETAEVFNHSKAAGKKYGILEIK